MIPYSGVMLTNAESITYTRIKDGYESTKVHIVQTEGVSDSAQEFPSFRMFDLEIISEATLLDDKPKFDISEQYNPES